MRIERIGLSEWEEVLPEKGFNVFHTAEALRLLERHSDTDLLLYGGYKGQEPIALLPLFIKREYGMKAVLSPPPGFGVRKIGPLLMPTSPKLGKQEKVNQEFTERVIDAVDGNSVRTLVFMSCGTRYQDPRPYQWANFDVDPAFTYRIPLDSANQDEVLATFSKSLRRDIDDAEDANVSVRVGSVEDARKVYTSTRDRFLEQDLKFPLPWEFVRDLIVGLDDRTRVYVAETEEGTFCGGVIVLYSNDTAYFWKGGARSEDLRFSVNGLLHWSVITDIITDPSYASIDQYDMYTANEKQIARYKSKFGGELVPYYRIKSDSLPMTVAMKGYRVVALGKGLLP